MTVAGIIARLPLLLSATFVLALPMPASVSALITNVDHADDICSPSDNPCVLDETAEVVDNTLDFGLRTLRIAPNGRLDTGNNTVFVLCGELIAEAGSTPAIKARGPSGAGSIDGGNLFITVSRGCSNAPSLACLRDSDCGGGTCTVGSGDVTILGDIRAQGQSPGLVDIRAAGSLSVDGLIDASGTTAESDGGSIDLLTVGTDLSIAGKLDATSGGASGGGAITLDSSADLFVSGEVDASGGDFDGGTIDMTAEGNIVVDGDVMAVSLSGEGWGGDISILAGGDIALRLDARIFSNGHTSSENFGGDGGEVSLEAGGAVSIGPTVRVEANGARPDGSGGTIDIIADGDFGLDGVLEARARGEEGTSGDVFVDGCAVALAVGARIESDGTDGTTAVLARGLVSVPAGSAITASASSNISIDYGDPAFPPALQGTVIPAPAVAFHPFLGDCGVCGDGAVNGNGDESCDDGNLVPGDGCNGVCHHEDCVAATPGYPQTSLCSDGLGCTLDFCDPQSGSCIHEAACSDFLDCTLDVCNAEGACEHIPDHSACDDASVCTDDVCSLIEGCRNTELAGACDDGLSCTSADTCVDGLCTGTTQCDEGFFCSASADACISLASTTTTTSSTTTSTSMPVMSACGDGVLGPGEECDGGVAWTIGAFCRSDCTRVACGDTDDNGAISAGDALFVLKAAVGLAACDGCVCDVDSSGGGVKAGDALRTLRRAVGLPISLDCPVCQ